MYILEKYFLMIRHGERLDYLTTDEKKNIIDIADPGLSKAGHLQATLSGEFIQTFCELK